MKKVNLRLNVTESERDMVRRAAALRGHRSMAEFCRSVVLSEATKIDLGKIGPQNDPQGDVVSHVKDASFEAS